MKRTIATILIVMALSSLFAGCELSEPDSISYMPKQEEAPESTSTPEPEPTQSPSIWYTRHFVDEFGDETDKVYVESEKIAGTFSNTATTNSNLSVYVSFEESNYKGDFISFRLLEYGRSKATHLSSESIDLAFKIDNAGSSETHYLTLTSSSDISSDVYTWEELNDYDVDDFHALINAMDEGQTFPCVIYIGKSSEYHFTIDGYGFADAVFEMEALNKEAEK